MIRKIECFLGAVLLILCMILGYELCTLEESVRYPEAESDADPNVWCSEAESDADPNVWRSEVESDTEVNVRYLETEFNGEASVSVEMPAELAGAYDGREAGRTPTMKNQGKLGTCWAVAATSALEAGLLPETRKIFSADHMSLQNAFGKEQNDGGDYTMAMAYLASWQGPVLEEEDPYGDGVSPDGLTAAYHVQEMLLLENKDYEAIKRAVKKYGAVQTSIYMDLKNEFSTSIYYNQLEYSYYYNGEERANHDILIVGWDDDYPADNFNVYTKQNGAFICQNSWGETFAEDGFFYVSYEDVNIGINGIVYSKIENSSNYDAIYQTDLCGWVGQLGYGDSSCWFANVYQAKQREILEAVGFYSTGANTEYRVYAVEKSDTMPSFALEEPIAEGVMENVGYYTVCLEEPMQWEAEKEYIVAVKIYTPETEYPVAAEYAADETTKNVILTDGEGYISHNGVLWTSAEMEYACNVCLKAYTKWK